MKHTFDVTTSHSRLRSYCVQAEGGCTAIPELAEKDADGTLRAALLLHCELLLVLPLWIGPKDESIYIWRAR